MTIQPDVLTRRALLEELVSHRKIHLCHAIRVVGSLEAAEDVLQNTAVKCLSTKEVKRPEKMSSYVSKMVRNAALDYVRKHRNEIPEAFDDEVRLATAGTDDRCGFTTLENKQTLAKVVGAIARFPLRKQDAFLRHRLAGVPQNRIAEDMAVSCTLVNFMIKEVDASCRSAQAI
ncbi:MAG: sigma-70 family RNA polymerase sigma factor [Pseudomonadota bacterium]